MTQRSARRTPRGGAAIAASLAAAAIATAMGGCNFGPPMAPVSGTVAMDGQPLRFGTVMFQHTEGGQPARAQIQPDGSFVLSTFGPEDGARVGEHRVRVACFEAQDPANADKPRGDSLGASLIPKKYANPATSGIKVTVVDGDNPPVAIELESGRGGRRR